MRGVQGARGKGEGCEKGESNLVLHYSKEGICLLWKSIHKKWNLVRMKEINLLNKNIYTLFDCKKLYFKIILLLIIATQEIKITR